MTVDIVTADVLDWARTYTGPKAHALLSDPPAGIAFMGKAWDRDHGGRDRWIDNMAEMAAALLEHMLPGAHAFVWAIPRTSHWTATAWENGGWEVRDRVTHLFGSGFPKSHNVGRVLDGWEGYGSALKPAAEDWWLLRKPLGGTIAETCERYGSGALWIDGARVPTISGTVETWPASRSYGTKAKVFNTYDEQGVRTVSTGDAPAGRWPPNFCLSHLPPTPCPCAGYTPDGAPIAGCRECGGTGTRPGCERVGVRRVASKNAIKGGLDGRTYNAHQPWGLRARPGPDVGYADADGLELVADWRCRPECPVRRLGEQSGERDSRNPMGTKINGVSLGGDTTRNIYGKKLYEIVGKPGYVDAGTAARFFLNADWSLDIAERIAAADPVLYCAKSSRSERNRGLPDGTRNSHPTQKPLTLAVWLSSLLLPPPAYAPRRILIPFAGAMSEAIGAMLAGWEHVTAIEREPEYVAIGESRVCWWSANRDKAPEVRAMGRAIETEARASTGRNPKGNGEASVYGRFNGTPNPAPMLPGLEATP